MLSVVMLNIIMLDVMAPYINRDLLSKRLESCTRLAQSQLNNGLLNKYHKIYIS
jgi:hypothetical protein